MLDAVVQVSIELPAFFYAIVFITSLMVGSFLNVVIYRLPIMMENSWKEEYQSYFSTTNDEVKTESKSPFNLVLPHSTCPHCGHKIRAWENIPVISYLFLGGKCSQCKTKISIRYPLVELFTAAVCTFAAWHYGPSSAALWSVLVCYVLIALIFIDADKMLLPDQLTLPLLWLGLLLSTQSVFVGMFDAIIGAAAGYLSLWSVYWLFKLATGKEGMGYGDFKLLAALGTFTGWQGLPIIILLSSLVGAIVGIIFLRLKTDEAQSVNGQAMPFGPYIAVAGFITLLYKDSIINAYINWLIG
ncbi:A24 family peptidase [Alteromonas sp. KUL49]|uniref:prepilin peptidase n=1 Tax=Alteromonas sp. KUL49 TaxID=2480798 RepID=UPI00102EF6EB|nr:A24 family peptidase [Alteromonas sp. KUL49]TAP41569.1 prepilin peptidase [Alteromonas sp. KUL49]GEA10666.1 type 4 prepilin-like proteins leader peptide-processing enzyme [Alteromonas sp. KUL49]